MHSTKYLVRLKSLDPVPCSAGLANVQESHCFGGRLHSHELSGLKRVAPQMDRSWPMKHIILPADRSVLGPKPLRVRARSKQRNSKLSTACHVESARVIAPRLPSFSSPNFVASHYPVSTFPCLCPESISFKMPGVRECSRLH